MRKRFHKREELKTDKTVQSTLSPLMKALFDYFAVYRTNCLIQALPDSNIQATNKDTKTKKGV